MHGHGSLHLHLCHILPAMACASSKADAVGNRGAQCSIRQDTTPLVTSGTPTTVLHSKTLHNARVQREGVSPRRPKNVVPSTLVFEAVAAVAAADDDAINSACRVSVQG